MGRRSGFAGVPVTAAAGLAQSSRPSPVGALMRRVDGQTEGRRPKPSIEGVDYPTRGIAQAHNDPDSRALIVETYAATSAHHGQVTTVSVTQLSDIASTRAAHRQAPRRLRGQTGATSYRRPRKPRTSRPEA
jgi:hypothetical protein